MSTPRLGGALGKRDRIIKVGEPVPAGEPKTRNGKKYLPVFEKAREVHKQRVVGKNTNRNDLPVVEGCTLEYVAQHRCVRITAKKSRVELSDAWLDISHRFPDLQFKPAVNDVRIAYLLFPDSTNPTTARIQDTTRLIAE